MRDWRSRAFAVLLVAVTIELCVVVAFFLRDGGPNGGAKATSSGRTTVVSIRQRVGAPPVSFRSRRATERAVVVADSSAFHYEGRWEHIAGSRDGSNGRRRSRTYARGARAILTFDGRFVRVYGVLGPGGGHGDVRIDGTRSAIVDFFAPARIPHHLVYASPLLKAGPHRLILAVLTAPRQHARRQYVNIDGVEFGS